MTVDMVVLAPAVRPPQDLRQLAQVLKVDVDEDGFLAAREMRGWAHRHLPAWHLRCRVCHWP
jgi:heterodisulfide reductase subunit A-like polyferredoxin